MKIIPLIVLLFCGFFSIGQKSYYFSNALPPEGIELQQIDPRYYGRYASNDGTMVYEINENGIRTISTAISSISRETLRESSVYEVRNGHIFGVLAGDSLPCVLEGDHYYFGVRNREILVGEGSLHTLKTLAKGKYLLNFSEGGNYLPVLIQFNGSGMEVLNFDYELGTDLFDFIAVKQENTRNGQQTVLLQPDQTEFDQLMEQGIFAGAQLFRKEVE